MKKNEYEENMPEWINDRTILMTRTGSHAYGTNTGDSDMDFKGICIPPVEYYLGLESFNNYNNTGGKNFKSTKDDKDLTILHINKFFKDAMKGEPNNIEILFVREEDIIKKTSLGQKVIDNRHLFLSKQIKRRYAGFANSQTNILKKSKGQGRGELVVKYGYDTKTFSHTIRLLTSAIEIIETGDYSTYRPNRELLLDCRNGRYTFNEALEFIEHNDEILKNVFEASELPEVSPYEKINELLVEINREGLTI